MRIPYQKWRQSARSVSTSLQSQLPLLSLGCGTHGWKNNSPSFGLRSHSLPLTLSPRRGARQSEWQSQVACQLAINMKPCPINTNTYSSYRRRTRPYCLIDAEREVWPKLVPHYRCVCVCVSVCVGQLLLNPSFILP